MKTLNIMGAREFWASKGKLYPCPNPQHDFKFGRVMGYWQWADDCWSYIDSSGSLQNFLFHIGTVENTNNTKALKVILWKLIVMVGVIK